MDCEERVVEAQAVEARVGRGVRVLPSNDRISPSARRKGMSTKRGLRPAEGAEGAGGIKERSLLSSLPTHRSARSLGERGLQAAEVNSADSPSGTSPLLVGVPWRVAIRRAFSGEHPQGPTAGSHHF